jgi:protein-S-isoprenylcysteine O-methyltransferase Ste14
MHTVYFICLGLYLTAHTVRTVYELLKRAGRANPESKILFAFIFMDMCALWISWFAMCPRDPSRIIVPNMIQWIGLTLVAAGLVIAIGALIQLKGLENIRHLVTTGLYSKMRHPMYTGFILWILGWAIYHGATISLGAGLAGIGNILFWRRLEEERLTIHFGDVYKDYRERTWF